MATVVLKSGLFAQPGRRILLGLGLLGLGFVLREHLAAAGLFAVANLWQMTPIVLAGLLVTAFLTATGSIGVLVATFDTRELMAIVVVSLIGAVLPVCGITVLPLVAGLLARLRQLGPLADDNLLIFRDRTPKGRHYTERPGDRPTGLQDSSFGVGCFGNAKSS